MSLQPDESQPQPYSVWWYNPVERMSGQMDARDVEHARRLADQLESLGHRSVGFGPLVAFTVHVDRDYGHDESFEADSEAQAFNIRDEQIGDPDTRRIWIEDKRGEVVSEWTR